MTSPRRRPFDRWDAGAGAVFAVAAATLAWFAVRAHAGFQTQMNDLGNAEHAIARAAAGDLAMHGWNTLSGVPGSRFREHANLVFWLLAPLYRLVPDARLLLVLAATAAATGGLAVYALARAKLAHPRWALAALIAFEVSPAVHDAALFDFHVVTLVSAAIAWAILAFETGRGRLAIACVVFAWLSAEDAAVLTAMLGVSVFLRGDRREGAALAAASLAWLAIDLGPIVHHFGGGRGIDASEGASRYAWLGRGALGLVRGVVARPGDALRNALLVDHARLPLAWLAWGALPALRRGRPLVLLLPLSAMGLLASGSWMTQLSGTYYWISAEVAIATACVLASAPRPDGEARFPLPLAWYAAVALARSAVLSPLPWSALGSWDAWRDGGDVTTLRALAREVPDDQLLCVENVLGAQLASRARITAREAGCRNADWYLFELRWHGGPDTGLTLRGDPDVMLGDDPTRYVARLRAMLDDPALELTRQEAGFYLFRRRRTGGARAEAPGRASRAAFARDADRFLAEVRSRQIARPAWVRWASGMMPRPLGLP